MEPRKIYIKMGAILNTRDSVRPTEPWHSVAERHYEREALSDFYPKIRGLKIVIN